MGIDAKQVAQRIIEARAARGLENYSALAQALRHRTGSGKPTNETVRLWEKGKHPPPYDMVELLSLELELPGEFILFGIKKDSIQQDRYVLENVSEEELQLLNYLRHTSTDHRADTIAHAELVAKRHPARLAQVKRFPGKRG